MQLQTLPRMLCTQELPSWIWLLYQTSWSFPYSQSFRSLIEICVVFPDMSVLECDGLSSWLQFFFRQFQYSFKFLLICAFRHLNLGLQVMLEPEFLQSYFRK
jgi:hypothetical protein